MVFMYLFSAIDDQLEDEDYALIAENTGIQIQRVGCYAHFQCDSSLVDADIFPLFLIEKVSACPRT